jgi:hypothetical protein
MLIQPEVGLALSLTVTRGCLNDHHANCSDSNSSKDAVGHPGRTGGHNSWTGLGFCTRRVRYLRRVISTHIQLLHHESALESRSSQMTFHIPVALGAVPVPETLLDSRGLGFATEVPASDS